MRVVDRGVGEVLRGQVLSIHPNALLGVQDLLLGADDDPWRRASE